MRRPAGYIQIYTGKGKGKTTSALGLALRARGAGQRVCWIQFMKDRRSSEFRVLQKQLKVNVQYFGRPGLIHSSLQTQDYLVAQKALLAVRRAVQSGSYDLVIADEICVAQAMGLLTEQAVLECMRSKPPEVELVLTGRGATRRMRNLADLVTEMRLVKHYYHQGIKARQGIEY